MRDEKKLLEDYINKRVAYDNLKMLEEEAKRQMEAAESTLFDFMHKEGRSRTATYEGIGFASVQEPEVYASCNKEFEQKLFDWLYFLKRGDMIKPGVHPRTLSSMVREMLNEGKDIPEFVSYYLKPNVRLCREAQKS